MSKTKKKTTNNVKYSNKKKRKQKRSSSAIKKAVIIFLTILLIFFGGFYLKEKKIVSLPDSHIVLLENEILKNISADMEDSLEDWIKVIEKCIKWIKAFVRTMEMYYGDAEAKIDLKEIPDYQDLPYYVINDNLPFFTKEEITGKSFEKYSDLDLLGRCGETSACIGRDIMPTEERGPIGMVKPSGWKIKKYDIVDGKYLYNRCHLIGYQLTGENANEKNLITGTRYMNVDGMLPFENQVADYVEKTGNHVMYRVTPLYEGNDLVAKGVQMEAWSVEDQGMGICFHVFVYNVQPGIGIDYATGESWLLK